MGMGGLGLRMGDTKKCGWVAQGAGAARMHTECNRLAERLHAQQLYLRWNPSMIITEGDEGTVQVSQYPVLCIAEAAKDKARYLLVVTCHLHNQVCQVSHHPR